MLIPIFFGFVVLLVIFLIFVATRPSAFTITRSAVIPAPSEAVFALVNDFHEWDHWSPWAKLDPECKNTFDGPSSGVGAKFAWDGNNQVGAGRMQIIQSRPNEVVKLDLFFERPMRATNQAEFTFQPDSDGTRVTWSMTGTNGFMGKLFNMIMNCDKMVGGEFEKGLENMRHIVTSV